MIRHFSIRIRLTLVTAALLTFCCVGLTIVLNYSAFQLVDKIDAAVITEIAKDPSKEQYEIPALSLEPATMSAQTQAAKKVFGLQSIVYMFVVIIGGSALTYYVSSKALKPLDELNKQVKNLTVNTLSQSIQISPTKDEIEDLGRSFNEMTDKLNESFLSQKRFSASAAHELRTPLAILQTKVDVFKKKSAPTQVEYEAMIQVFDKQIVRLRNLVDQLLAMTHSQEEQEPCVIHLKEMFEDVVCELSSIAQSKQISMTLTCDQSCMIANVDLLYQAFYNLIENAIKYNVQGGRVELIVKQLDDNVSISIIDSGIGIPDEMKKQIFEPFFRVDPSRSREIAGVGLGLSIVDHIVKRYNGSIQVFDGEQGGTCFQILFKS